jgi:hypothetical protein
MLVAWMNAAWCWHHASTNMFCNAASTKALNTTLVHMCTCTKLQYNTIAAAGCAGLPAAGRSLLAASSNGFYQGSANTIAASNTASAIADAANGRIPTNYATK